MRSAVACDSIPAPCAAPGRRRGAHRAGPGDDDDDDETPIGDPPDDDEGSNDEDDDADDDDEDPLQFVMGPGQRTPLPVSVADRPR